MDGRFHESADHSRYLRARLALASGPGSARKVLMNRFQSDLPETPGKLLSVILLSYYSGKRLRNCHTRLREVLRGAGIPFELIIMDDGSKDDSYAIALEMEREFPEVRAYQLSRNYTSHYSIFAGLSVCRGACAMPIPDDEQQPYDSIVQLYRVWESGEKVIIPHRSERNDPAISKFFAQSYYRIMNALSDVKFPPGGADSFMIDREVIDIINTRIHPINTSTLSEILRMGFSPKYVPFVRESGTNQKSRWTFRKKVKLAKDVFFSSSSFPIQFITRTGVFFAGFALFFALLFAILKLGGWGEDFFNEGVRGWTSLMIAITFFSGLILFSLGIIAEYIYRIYEEVKARPGYIIREKKVGEERIGE
jgi:glycosyltransferase involved in cell wall biosynthesis